LSDSPRSQLPTFKYHPDPLATGAIEVSEARCECCGEARGYAYTSGTYGEKDLSVVCPWCISDGRLEREHDASLSADHGLLSAGISKDVVREVTCRTPGYSCWQSEEWLTCCGDACAFHGEPLASELRALDADGLSKLSSESTLSVEDLREIFRTYEPGGSPAFYKFICLHCGRIRYGWDCD